ncbi:hypothetical protein KY284_005685 [Solanum tuberosum]|nr:hypothetical protein KY284_005685 [Solanum tuberosum]
MSNLLTYSKTSDLSFSLSSKPLTKGFKFEGILVSEVGPVYVGGRTEYVENVDEDHLSIPELADYAKSFGIMVESFNAHGKPDGSLTAQQKKPDLGLGSSSSFPSSERVENDGVASVQQETDDDYSSIDWTDTEEEGETTVQQGTEPFIQEEVEPSAQENVEEDIDSDSICSDQSIDYGSDVHEELRIVKEDVRKLKKVGGERRRKKQKVF